MVAGKAVAAGLGVVSLVTILSGVGYHFKPYFTGEGDVELEDEGDEMAVAGRIVSISAEVYKEHFGALSLGHCARSKVGSRTMGCQYNLKGDPIFIPKTKMTVDVTKVETTEDILNHVMGGVGVTVGALGIISVTPKVKAAVTTKTNKKSLNLVSSYEVNLGVETLHRPRPDGMPDGRAPPVLYLSEIEYGGNEALIVTLEFESEDKKTHVEVTVTIKILWWSITAKVEYIEKTAKLQISCRAQLISSWRGNVTKEGANSKACVGVVKDLEEKYLSGPSELRERERDTTLHYFYHFASWVQSPFGRGANQAVINRDLQVFNEQATEIHAIIARINKMRLTDHIMWLNNTIGGIVNKLTDGLQRYHHMSDDEKFRLRHLYGNPSNYNNFYRAPQYYSRLLNKFAKESGQ